MAPEIGVNEIESLWSPYRPYHNMSLKMKQRQNALYWASRSILLAIMVNSSKLFIA